MRIASPAFRSTTARASRPASHMNFVIANGAVIAPIYDERRRRFGAGRLARACFPDGQVIGLPARAILHRRRLVPLHHPAGAGYEPAHDHDCGAAERLRRGPGRQHRPHQGPGARGGGHGRPGDSALGTVPGPLFLRRPGRALVRRRPPLARASLRHRAGAACGGAGRGDPHFDLRAGRTALLQQPGHGRRRRRLRSGSIARATSPTGRAIRRSTTSAPATPAFAFGTPDSAVWAWASAGTNGFPRRPAP